MAELKLDIEPFRSPFLVGPLRALIRAGVLNPPSPTLTGGEAPGGATGEDGPSGREREEGFD